MQRNLTVLFALYAEGAVRSLFVWQLFTYMFLHGGIPPAVQHADALVFRHPAGARLGHAPFPEYYFYCGIAAGVCVLAANMAVGDWVRPTIGASGAIFGVLVAFGVLYPNQTVLMNFLFPIKAKYMVMIYAAIELLMTLGPNTGVSTVAHLGGMAFGYVYLKGRLPRQAADLRVAYRQWKLQRAKKKFQVYMRKHGNGPWAN